MLAIWRWVKEPGPWVNCEVFPLFRWVTWVKKTGLEKTPAKSVGHLLGPTSQTSKPGGRGCLVTSCYILGYSIEAEVSLLKRCRNILWKAGSNCDKIWKPLGMNWIARPHPLKLAYGLVDGCPEWVNQYSPLQLVNPISYSNQPSGKSLFFRLMWSWKKPSSPEPFNTYGSLDLGSCCPCRMGWSLVRCSSRFFSSYPFPRIAPSEMLLWKVRELGDWWRCWPSSPKWWLHMVSIGGIMQE